MRYWNFKQARTEISTKLGLDFDRAGTKSAMTHILVLSVKVRRIEWLWHTPRH